MVLHFERPNWHDTIHLQHVAHPDEPVAVLVCARKELVESLTKQCNLINQLRKEMFTMYQELF